MSGFRNNRAMNWVQGSSKNPEKTKRKGQSNKAEDRAVTWVQSPSRGQSQTQDWRKLQHTSEGSVQVAEPEMELETGNLLRQGCSTQGWAEIRLVGPRTKNKLANLNTRVIFYMLSVFAEFL